MHALIFVALAVSACMTSKVQLDSRWRPGAPPSYEDYMDTFLLGFVGHNEISLARVCMDQKPYGLIRKTTATDGFLTFITAGIYTPTTVRVWCGD